MVNPNAALSQVLMRVRPGVTNYYIHGLGLLYEITETATTTITLPNDAVAGDLGYRMGNFLASYRQ